MARDNEHKAFALKSSGDSKMREVDKGHGDHVTSFHWVSSRMTRFYHNTLLHSKNTFTRNREGERYEQK